MYFLFLLSKRSPRSYSVLAILAANLVISMTAPPIRRSPGDFDDGANGFSGVPKILEIQLPLKIATKEDIVAWAKYVMGLTASKINITLTTVKEAPPVNPTTVRKNTDSVKQPQNVQSYRKPENVKLAGNVRNFSKNYESMRYAENVQNIGSTRGHKQNKNSGNGRNRESERGSLRTGNHPAIKEKQFPNPTSPAFLNNGASSKNWFNNQQTPLNFPNLRITDSTLQNPLEITANINIPRTRFKEADFRGVFDVPQTFKLGDQLFVPQFPDFGPIVDLKSNEILRKTHLLPSTARTYFPSTIADNIKFPTDPFATRYFFDGVERNASTNLGVLSSNTVLTTQRPTIFHDKIPFPVKSIDLSNHRNLSNITPLFKVPFEAVITITREGNLEPTTLANEKEKYFIESIRRDPPDEFPPFFDTNYTLNESGQINVVFDDGSGITESLNNTRKEERGKQSKKKDSSKNQKQKKEKATRKQPSPIGQILKTIGALRRNRTLSTELSPPPLKAENFPQSQRMQVSTQRPSSARQGRRNETSEAQELEDDDEDSNESDNGNGDDSAEKDNDDDVESNGGNDSGSNENAASQEDDDNDDDDDYDDDDDDGGGGGGVINALIGFLRLVAPVLEDLSDPDSDADVADVIEAAVPLLQDLSEGDGITEGIDFPAVLVPILLQLSGNDDGRRDSAAILRPLLQLSAPLVGPLSGPLIVPLSRQSSHPPGEGGSNIGDLLKSIIGPLSEPAGPGQMSPFSKLIATVVSSLSKYGKNKSDITSLVKAMVAGSIAGSSAGSSPPRDSYGAPTGYGGGGGGGGGNSYAPAQANPFAMVGSSFNDILKAILKLVTSLVKAISGLLGASSNSSQDETTYGPPPPSYGPPAYMSPPSKQPPTNSRPSQQRNRFN